MRVYALYLLVAFLALYAWRDWYKALCGLILIMAVIEHPDMPKSIAGIQGFNPWNILLLSVFLAWLVTRGREGLVWDLPRGISLMLILYLGVILVGVGRMLADRSNMVGETTTSLVSEYLINTVKWVIPGLLLYDGCRSQQRLKLAMVCILAMYALLAVQVIRWMPASAAVSGGGLSRRALKIISSEVGYSRVNMSRMLAGASWAILATLPLMRKNWHKVGIVILFVIVAYGQALTGGRMGYVTWGMIGLILCVIKWRKLLPLAIAVPILAVVFMPGVRDRMLMGFGATDVTGESTVDRYEVTAGRSLIWPHVLDKISQAPFTGYGRQAMIRTGLRDEMLYKYGEGESFPHPHNAYLELLLDNGLIGFILIMPFYGVLVIRSMKVFLDRRRIYCSAVGGICISLLLALLVAGMGSQTFYPREAEVGLWAAIALMLRLYTQVGGRFANTARFAPISAR